MLRPVDTPLGVPVGVPAGVLVGYGVPAGVLVGVPAGVPVGVSEQLVEELVVAYWALTAAMKPRAEMNEAFILICRSAKGAENRARFGLGKRDAEQ